MTHETMYQYRYIMRIAYHSCPIERPGLSTLVIISPSKSPGRFPVNSHHVQVVAASVSAFTAEGIYDTELENRTGSLAAAASLVWVVCLSFCTPTSYYIYHTTMLTDLSCRRQQRESSPRPSNQKHRPSQVPGSLWITPRQQPGVDAQHRAAAE